MMWKIISLIINYMNLNTILKGEEPSDVGAAIENFYEKRRIGSRLP
jgi:hypothetical protein